MQLAEDFAFLNNYGFTFSYELKHHETPSVVFINSDKKIKINIGYSYNEQRLPRGFFTFIYGESIKFREDNSLLDGITITGSSYKDQLEQVKKILLNYLQSKT